MITITVAPGDTLSGIAAQYGSSVSAIASENGISDPNLIYAGQKFAIPVGGSFTQWSPASSGASGSGSSQASGGGATAGTSSPSGGGSAVGGSFGSCVRFRENSNSYSWGTGNGGGAYQFEPSTWAAYAPAGAAYGSASPAQQDQAFANAVAALGTSPWQPYDGCSWL